MTLLTKRMFSLIAKSIRNGRSSSADTADPAAVGPAGGRVGPAGGAACRSVRTAGGAACGTAGGAACPAGSAAGGACGGIGPGVGAACDGNSGAAPAAGRIGPAPPAAEPIGPAPSAAEPPIGADASAITGRECLKCPAAAGSSVPALRAGGLADLPYLRVRASPPFRRRNVG